MTLGPLMVDLLGTDLAAEERELLRHPLVGGVVLFSRNFSDAAQVTQLIADVRAVRSPPLLVAVDQEGGRVQRFRRDFTILPSMRLIGHQYDMDPGAGRTLARQCGWLMAAEMRAVGIDLSFAPVVDLDYGISEVIGDRAFHRQADAVADLAVAFARGMREAGMAATAKHFPGHGAVVADSHVALPVDRREYFGLLDDMRPYERLIDNGLTAVMAAHVVYAAVDERPAGFSQRWLRSELRGRLGFDGAIFSDDLSMAGAAFAGDMTERVHMALEAGCDMLLLCNDRAAVSGVLGAMKGTGDPLSQVRLARLHGRPAQPARDELMRTAEWRAAERAVARCLERPSLNLDA